VTRNEWRDQQPTVSSVASALSSNGQRTVEVEIQIVGIFETGRQPQQISRAGRAFPFDRGTVLNEAFDTAE
jgi:hypothetical protein